MGDLFSDFSNFSGEFAVIMPSPSIAPSYRDMVLFPNKRKTREEPSGYPLSRFEMPPPSEFLCVYCQNVVKKPVECNKCSKLYCHDCISALQKNSDSSRSQMFLCSVCGTSQEIKRPSLILVRIISELKIKCINFDAGCKGQITIEELNRHDLTCPYREITCANYRNCRKFGFIKDFLESECPLRSIYNNISGRPYGINKCYLCSDKCKKIIDFEKAVSDKQIQKSLQEYYNVLKQCSEPNEDQV